MKTQENYDIIIIGSGIVGASLACLLAQQGFKLALIDQGALPEEKEAITDLRFSAINHASRQLFDTIGVWDSIVNLASAYQRMFVWDKEGQIDFNAIEMKRDELGWIVQNKVILLALIEKIKAASKIDYIPNCSPENFTVFSDNATLLTNKGRFWAKLIVGADGANSWLRQKMNIDLKIKSYEQTAIVANVTMEKSHEKTAWQHFLPTGPLALLPLSDPHTCSIVWSLNKEKAAETLSLNNEKFSEAISSAFDHRLGKIELMSERKSFPLIMRHAKQYVDTRTALVGDAIHTIHPLAGLGLNVGLMDAACLNKTLAEALNETQDIGALQLLLKYQRERKSQNLMALMAMDGFKHLFSNENSFLSWLRNEGLTLANKNKLIKSFFIEKANFESS